jgi:AcrR family transcriptional regulator
MYSKGYEQMTIQDIVDDLQISKGAFYHYFDSKQAAFSALLERMGQELDQHLLPIVQDPALPALEKLQCFFAALAGWKYERLEILLAVTRIWYSDDNAIIRSQLRRARVKHFAPQFAAIIQEGCQQGVLLTDYPEQMGEVVVSLILDLNDAMAEILLSNDRGSDAGPRLECTIAAYTQTLLGALRAPSGSLQLVDTEYLRKWLIEL